MSKLKEYFKNNKIKNNLPKNTKDSVLTINLDKFNDSTNSDYCYNSLIYINGQLNSDTLNTFRGWLPPNDKDDPACLTNLKNLLNTTNVYENLVNNTNYLKNIPSNPNIPNTLPSGITKNIYTLLQNIQDIDPNITDIFTFNSSETMNKTYTYTEIKQTVVSNIFSLCNSYPGICDKGLQDESSNCSHDYNDYNDLKNILKLRTCGCFTPSLIPNDGDNSLIGDTSKESPLAETNKSSLCLRNVAPVAQGYIYNNDKSKTFKYNTYQDINKSVCHGDFTIKENSNKNTNININQNCALCTLDINIDINLPLPHIFIGDKCKKSICTLYRIDSNNVYNIDPSITCDSFPRRKDNNTDIKDTIGNYIYKLFFKNEVDSSNNGDKGIGILAGFILLVFILIATPIAIWFFIKHKKSVKNSLSKPSPVL